MLPPFIIEQIRKREEEEQRHYEQPQLELPVPSAIPMRRPRSEEAPDDVQRGVLILEF